MSNEPEKWVSLKEIAAHIGVSEDTIRLWIKKARFLIAVPEDNINLKFQR